MKKIRRIILILLMVVFSASYFLSMHSNLVLHKKRNDDTIAIYKYESLIKADSKATAFMENGWLEIPKEINDSTRLVYSTKYKFEVNESTYHGTAELLEKPSVTNLHFEVYYLPLNPAVNAYSPERLLAKEKEIRSSKENLYAAIVYGILGSVIAGILIFDFIKYIRIRIKN